MRIEFFHTIKGGFRARACKDVDSIELFSSGHNSKVHVLTHCSGKQEFPLCFTFDDIKQLENLISIYKKHVNDHIETEQI